MTSRKTSNVFRRYIGIDYSGAKTPVAGLSGLRVYVATPKEEPTEVRPYADPKRHWSRRGIAEWLVACLRERTPTIVGIDHGFSFPMAYFERYGMPPDWRAFLDDFVHHWPTDGADTSVDLVRNGTVGLGRERMGNSRWRRLAEVRSRGAKSVFHFGVPGSVATSTHAGLPWLRHIRQHVPEGVHFWPFDGWSPPVGTSIIAEVYPSLWSRRFPSAGRTPDQHDAWSVAAWLRRSDLDGTLTRCFDPALSPPERAVAMVEGWILGLG